MDGWIMDVIFDLENTKCSSFGLRESFPKFTKKEEQKVKMSESDLKKKNFD